MSKYPWAMNTDKLQRAIAKANQEQQPLNKRETRIKELYVSYGGKLNEVLEEKVADVEEKLLNNQDKTMSEENVEETQEEEVANQEETNDTTDNTEDNSPAEEDESDVGGSDSADDSTTGETSGTSTS